MTEKEIVEAIQSAWTNGRGVCCCGEDMERHSDPMWCGHMPVDSFDYYTQELFQEMSKLTGKSVDELYTKWVDENEL